MLIFFHHNLHESCVLDFYCYIGMDFFKVPYKMPTISVVEQYDILDRTRDEFNEMIEVRGFKIKGSKFSEL